MKTRYNALHGVAIMLGLLLVGVSGAWADLKKSQMGNEVCSPIVHFKLPSGWTNAYLMISGSGVPFGKADASGWMTIDLATAKANDDAYFYINGVNKNDCQDGMCVTKNGVNVKPNDARLEGFTCKDVQTDGGEIWIQEHPDIKKEGLVYVTLQKPNVLDFYVFLPDNQTWKSATPMLQEDGKDHEMYVDNDHCGWYYRRYIDEPLPQSVILHRDDDPELNGAIGMGGEKALEEGQAAEPIALADIISIFEGDANYHDAVYFVADQAKADALPPDNYGWFSELQTTAVGNCSYNLAAVIYDTDAQLHPLFSCYATGAGPTNDGCQAVGGTTAAQGLDKTTALTAVYNCLGVTTGLVESTLGSDKKPKLSAAGKKCFVDEKYFNQLFNYTKDVNEMSCYDMTFERSKDGKWEFDSDNFFSPGLTNKVRGGFYPVEDTDDAKIIATLLPDGSVQTPAPKARTKRTAEGPVYYGPLVRANDPTEQIPKIDIFCNGPGWNKGHDCATDHLFADGDATTEAIQTGLKLGTDACVFGWSCDQKGFAPEGWPFFASGSETSGTQTLRWTSEEGGKGNGGRNQHFCFESHANFRYKPNLKFNFRGDDDIWVFIDNKLAVDLGGTHLAAPGYVDVDYFLKKNGVDLSTIEAGHSFDIDIFFCDRRTTMSNVRVKTNMFIEQTTGIKAEGKQDINAYMKDGDNIYKICYKESGNGSCSAAIGSSEQEWCGEEIIKAGKKISFVLTRDKTGQDPLKEVLHESDFEKNSDPYGNGAIDVSKPWAPVINDEKLSLILTSGKYYLIVKIGNDTRTIEITIKGKIGITSREAVYENEDGVKSFPYEFKSQMMASSLKEDGTPDVNQMIPLYVASLIDPCIGVPNCTDPLVLQSAANTSYKLNVTNSKAVFYKMKGGKLEEFDPKSGTVVSEGGVDTIYVTIPLNDMSAAVEPVSINVVGSSNKADIKFFVPRLVFVDSDSTFNPISADEDNPKEPRLRGSAYPFYLVAVNGDDSPCLDCNFTISKGSRTSSGVNIISGSEVVNGRATIYIQSQLVYEKCSDPSCRGAAKLHVVCSTSPALMYAEYQNLQFSEPPVPTPQFADIFDVHGEKLESDINVPTPYHSPEQEYLDGIGDSLVIYYHREFHKDSLPDSIFVYWESEKDSVKFDASDIARGTYCGTAKGAKTDSTCVNMITLSGKKLSKDVKTAGTGTLKSWATFTARGASVTKDYPGIVYDRIAPIIVSARAKTDTSSGKNAQLVVTFSEKVQKTTQGMAEDDKIFSFYINAGKDHHFAESIALAPGLSYGKTLAETHTFIYNQNSEFPQAGDYIHFRGIDGVGLMKDVSEYDSIPGADTLRIDNTDMWNIAPPYNSPAPRIPSPWALITGDVSSYAIRLIPEGYGAIPLTPSEAAKLPNVEVFSFDAFKDEKDFKNAIVSKQGDFEDYGFVPHGWFVKSDMSALIVADTATQKAIGNNYKNIFFYYEIQMFTNLGSHVLTKKGKIYCDDRENMEKNGRTYFDNKNCVEKPKNFFIAWNMKGDDNRLVGSGAFVSKLNSYVYLGDVVKKRKNKFDKTEMWGVRHHTKVIGSCPFMAVSE